MTDIDMILRGSDPTSAARLIRKIEEMGGSSKGGIIAIDGFSASGKTTLAARLQERFDCNVFHMDDFFLRPEQRSAQRLAIPGENIDHERFYEDVLMPLKKRQTVILNRYSCKTGQFEPPVCVPYRPLNIIEGVYSLHRDLAPSYDLRVLLTIDSETQRERILKRNAPEIAQKYFELWIPMEEAYFLFDASDRSLKRFTPQASFFDFER